MSGKTVDEPTWHAGKLCDGGACVEIGTQGGFVLIRSTANPDGPYVTLSRNEWQVFLAGARDGEFDGV